MCNSATPWAVAHQAPLSMGFSRQEYWSGLPCPPAGGLAYPGIQPESPALKGRFFNTSLGSPLGEWMELVCVCVCVCVCVSAVRQRALISGKQAVPGHCVPCLFLGPGYRRQQGPMCVCVQVSFWLPHPRFKFLKSVPEWKGCGEILPGAGLGWAWGPVCLSSKRGALSGPRGSLEGKEPFLSKEGKGD